jgi:Leu/Phe-tRNA-protein transferase
MANELVGGLYGISIGKIFFGESMFSLRAECLQSRFYHPSSGIGTKLAFGW